MSTLASTQREIALEAIDAATEELIALSRDIHAHPELNFQEHHAAQVLSDALVGRGFHVERPYAGVETAFRADAGDGASRPTVGFLAEYDALPDVGHGCGHNLIAISNLGGFLGVAAALRGQSLSGRAVLLGTPAEEGGGGKIRMLEAGGFDGLDVALSSHPGSHLTVIPTEIAPDAHWALAMIGFRYEYRGRAAHAAAAPEKGVNALNSVIHLFTGVDALRQHLRPDVRIHGVITDGGTAPNVVPDFAAANFMLRSADREYLHEVVEKVQHVAEGAALITGAQLEIKPFFPNYENIRPNAVLARRAHANAESVGIPLSEGLGGASASTDFGNVSQRFPSFALSFAISETPVAGHSLAMAAAACSDLAHARALQAAKILALTALDLIEDDELLRAARADFELRSN